MTDTGDVRHDAARTVRAGEGGPARVDAFGEPGNPGDPDLPLTPTFVDDFARTVAVLGRQDRSDAAVWHVPHPPATTGRALAAEACRQAGTRSRLLRHGTAQARALGLFVPIVREGAELVYQFEQPFVVDGSRATRAFGLEPTRYEDGVGQTLAALRAAQAKGPEVSR